jgi:hypothetical protein
MKLGFMAMMLKQKPISRNGVSITSPRPQKSTGSLVQCERGTVFFDCEGIIHHEFLPRGQIVNKEYYLKVMKRLRVAVGRKGLICGEGKNGCRIMTMLWYIPSF